MNDPEWTQGIHETAKTLQYKRIDGKKSKKNDDELVRYVKNYTCIMSVITILNCQICVW